eukprot:4686316-Amphidinium_carterae.1
MTMWLATCTKLDTNVSSTLTESVSIGSEPLIFFVLPRARCLRDMRPCTDPKRVRSHALRPRLL